MRAFTVSLLVCLLSTLSVSIQAASLQITILNQKGEPVENAVITATPLVTKITATKQQKVIDQINKEYVPRVIIVTKGSTVDFPNNDNIRHQVYSFSPSKQFELPLYKGKTAKPVEFDKLGIVTLGCNIHDWMRGYVYVSETPFAVLTDSHGKAKLTDLPEDTYKVNFWHPRLKVEIASQQIKLSADSTTEINSEFELKKKIKKRKKRKGRYKR